MLWKKQDFERELRRQLVELAALRNRVPLEKEILERLDRMEASHRGLLRKLNELFASAAAAPEAGAASAASMASPDDAFSAAIETCAGSPSQLVPAASLESFSRRVTLN